MRVKIYGLGWVGRSVRKLFPEAAVVDPALNLNQDWPCDVAFVCVPTPLKNGTLDLSIVESVIRRAPEELIILRSTVLPGFCDRFANKNIVYQPEYLGETVGHPLFDETKVPFMILGGYSENRRRAIELYQGVYSANIRIRQVTNYEAEIIKLAENTSIAWKVAQCQELFDICSTAGVDYYIIREAVLGDDPRFNLWFSFVYPDKRGFESKCIPKDVYGFCAWAESLGYDPVVTKAILARNELYLQQPVSLFAE